MKKASKTILEQMTLKLKRQRFTRNQKLEMETTTQKRMILKLLRINHAQAGVERAHVVEIGAAYLMEAEARGIVVVAVIAQKIIRTWMR